MKRKRKAKDISKVEDSTKAIDNRYVHYESHVVCAQYCDKSDLVAILCAKGTILQQHYIVTNE